MALLSWGLPPTQHLCEKCRQVTDQKQFIMGASYQSKLLKLQPRNDTNEHKPKWVSKPYHMQSNIVYSILNSLFFGHYPRQKYISP